METNVKAKKLKYLLRIEIEIYTEKKKHVYLDKKKVHWEKNDKVKCLKFECYKIIYFGTEGVRPCDTLVLPTCTDIHANCISNI